MMRWKSDLSAELGKIASSRRRWFGRSPKASRSALPTYYLLAITPFIDRQRMHDDGLPCELGSNEGL